jgi:hypothetical protein
MRTALPTSGVRNWVLAGTVLAAALSPCIAGAALGESEASVQADTAQLRAAVKVTAHANYRLHEATLPSGTKLREFVGPDGKVFAVAWNGPTVPNLRQCFGRYFEPFVSAARAQRSGHSHLRVRTGDLVVESGGHMRAFAGRAYLTDAVPSGVDLGDLH